MRPPDPLDFLDLDERLNDDERLIRDTVSCFVADRILPDVADWFEQGSFPGSSPRSSAPSACSACTSKATAAPAPTPSLRPGLPGAGGRRLRVRSFVSVQGSLAMFPIWRYGSEEQKQRWLPRMAAGEAIGCFGLTEPDFGSNPAGMRTSARRDGGDWVLNGTKMWITNGGIADVAVVWARTEDEGVRGFLVPAGTPGFTAREIDRKLSLRASVTSELVLEDCRLPADAVLPEVRGMRGPLSCLNEARFGIIWGSWGRPGLL